MHSTAPTTYYVIQYLNINNIYAAVSAKQSSEYVKYLGQFDSTKECMMQCVNTSTLDNLCMSYTYQTSAIKDEFEKTCYGRFGPIFGPYWNPYPGQNGINSGQIIWKCRSNLDCSLNGICSQKTGNCTCNKGWKGARCNDLNLLPATKGNGYNYLNKNDNFYSSWGGSVLSKNNAYYMVASEFINHCGIYSWVMNSRVILAKSTNGFNSPYTRQSIIAIPDSHEPDFAMGPNGEFVVYHSYYNRSIEGYSPCTGCNEGATGRTCNGPDTPLFYTQMIYTEDITADEVKWSDPINIFANGQATDVDSNFAAVILKNGSVVGMMRKPDQASILYLVTATDWKDARTYKEYKDPLFPQLIQWYAEDPVIWIDCDGYYHALFHNMQTDGVSDIGLNGAHAFSEDGINWIWGGVGFGAVVDFTDGTSMTFHSLERPHIILDASDGCTLLALTSGAFPGDGNEGYKNDQVYTLIQPVA